MITGVGVDIIEVKRIKKLAESNPRFIQRVFTKGEISYCLKKRNKYQHLAARFAAKEAFFKALGRRINWKDIELINLPSGKPRINTKLKESLQVNNAHVSISHLEEYAIAAVVLDKKAQPNF